MKNQSTGKEITTKSALRSNPPRPKKKDIKDMEKEIPIRKNNSKSPYRKVKKMEERMEAAIRLVLGESGGLVIAEGNFKTDSYAVVQDKKVVFRGSKKECHRYRKQHGGTVYLTAKSIGATVESKINTNRRK